MYLYTKHLLDRINIYFNLICMELRKTRELFVVNIP